MGKRNVELDCRQCGKTYVVRPGTVGTDICPDCVDRNELATLEGLPGAVEAVAAARSTGKRRPPRQPRPQSAHGFVDALRLLMNGQGLLLFVGGGLAFGHAISQSAAGSVLVAIAGMVGAVASFGAAQALGLLCKIFDRLTDLTPKP